MFVLVTSGSSGSTGRARSDPTHSHLHQHSSGSNGSQDEQAGYSSGSSHAMECEDVSRTGAQHYQYTSSWPASGSRRNERPARPLPCSSTGSGVGQSNYISSSASLISQALGQPLSSIAVDSSAAYTGGTTIPVHPIPLPPTLECTQHGSMNMSLSGYTMPPAAPNPYMQYLPQGPAQFGYHPGVQGVNYGVGLPPSGTLLQTNYPYMGNITTSSSSTHPTEVKAQHTGETDSPMVGVCVQSPVASH